MSVWQKNFCDFGHSGCRQGPISAKKRFSQKRGLPEYFFFNFLALIMYQDLFSNISKICDTIFCLRKIISKSNAIFEIIFPKQKQKFSDTLEIESIKIEIFCNIFSTDQKSHNPQKLLEPQQARTTLLELAKEINSYPDIEEFDEKKKFKRTPYQTSGNRPVFARNRYPNRNFRQHRPGKQRGMA